MALHNLHLWPTTDTPRTTQIFIMIILLFCASDAFGQILTLTPSLSLSERYDDNIFQTDTNEEDDFITVITPGIQLRYQPASDTLLDMDYHPDIEIFAQNSDQSFVGHRGTLKFQSPIARFLSISLRDTLIITEDPSDRVREIGETDPNRPSSQESREQTIRNSATVNLEFLLTPRSRLGFLYENLIEDVEDLDEVDEFRNTIGVELGYLTDVRRENRLRLFYDATFHRLTVNDPTRPDEPDFQVHTINIGYLHAFSSTLTGDAAIGYAIATSSESSTIDEETALVASIGLVKTLRTGSMALRYRRDFTSGGGDGGLVLADVFTLALTSGLTPKITADLGVRLGFFDFQEAGESDRVFFTIRPNLAYQILRFWRLALGYEFANTNFDRSTEADRREHRLTFGSQFIVRESLFLSLNYQYRTRQFDESGTRDENEFSRNEVTLTVTYAPTLLFGR